MAVLALDSFAKLVEKILNSEIKGNITDKNKTLSFLELTKEAKKNSRSIFEQYGPKNVFFVEAHNDLAFVINFLANHLMKMDFLILCFHKI